MEEVAREKTTGWQDIGEKGTVLGIRFFLVLLSVFGRSAARGFLAVVMLYYAAFHGRARRHSRVYLERVGEPTGFANVYRHFLRFGQCALDRVLLIRGSTKKFDIRSTGREHLIALQESKTGAILLGAHLGSFEAMRGHATTFDLPVHVVMQTSNARRINSVLEQINPQSKVRVIELGDGGIDFVFRIRKLIERGEYVAILGDRVGNGAAAVETDFLGSVASFPTGPYLLAAALSCPVMLTVNLYRGGNRYDVYCEPFAQRIILPRKGREAAVAAYVKQYAQSLERYCRMAPYNWFNFFDFWKEPL